MIAVDTSALVAILLKEPDAEQITKAILSDDEPLMSVGSWIELIRVMKAKRGTASLPLVDELLAALEIELVSVSAEHGKLAAQATLHFPILNYGDTFAYALAKSRDIPLLFKGEDFSRTDIEIVAY